MENKPLLSLCIPTNGIVEWIMPVINSIYNQGVDDSLFEVIVTDNGPDSELGRVVNTINRGNFYYYKSSSIGFTNQIDAFEKCHGVFCKMLNHRSKLLPGSIKMLIDLVEKYKETRPIIYCAEGRVTGNDLIECANTEEFVRKMSYWISWSAGIGAWKSDLAHLRDFSINKMFPHTVFLFGLREESNYLICNIKYEEMSSDAGKGGYDLFHTFGVTFLDIINDLRIKGRISISTFILVKRELYNFLRGLYFNEVMMPTNHTFIIKNVPDSIEVYFGRYYYNKMVLRARLLKPFVLVQSVFRNLLKK